MRADAGPRAPETDAWMAQLSALAKKAVRRRETDLAPRLLDVMLDQDPDHPFAADLKARLASPSQ